MERGDDEDMKKGKMRFSKISKGYFCKIVISMEVQEVVMEVQEESLIPKYLFCLLLPTPRNC